MGDRAEGSGHTGYGRAMGEASETMTAASVSQPGPSANIVVGPLPVPTPHGDDVLVRVQALAVNHVDTFIRSGAYRTPVPWPFVIGRDLVGVVEETGPRVTEFAVGDHVWCNSLGHNGRQGSFAEYALAGSDRLYRLPAGVDPVEAVATLHTGATACLGLFREARIRIGETIAVLGAAGGVGSSTVQLASAAGARVIATARESDADWCRACGADEVFDYRDPEVFTRIADHAPQGVDVLWDNSGRNDLEQTMPLLARGARVLVTSGLGGTATVPVGPLYTRDIGLHGFAISNATTTDLARAAQVINHELARGQLRARIAARLPLIEAAEAHRRQETGPSGRIVVVP